MMQNSKSSGLPTSGPSNMTEARSGLARQGSVARTNAIAMLKRAASQREMKSRAPFVPGAFPSETTPPLASSDTFVGSSNQLLSESGQLLQSSTRHGPTDHSVEAPIRVHHPFDAPQPSYSFKDGPYPADNAVASTSTLPPTAMLTTPSPNDSSDRSRSPMFLQDRSNPRTFNRSPLPSLEQLRARILLERESAGLQRSASTSAASQAARAYALEKLLGNSGTDVFYDHTPDGTPIGRGAATPSPTRTPGADDDMADMASDDESAHETRLKRQSMKNRPSLRRSRTINGLTAMAEAQNKADFVQGVFLAVPGPASKRISRIHQRRIERQSMLKSASSGPTEASVPEETSQDEAELPPAPVAEAPPSLSRQQSQRQIARTEMMRKLSTRGRGNATPATQLSPKAQTTHLATTAPEQGARLRLPQVITNSPAVDETISPVGVVIRPPSSPIPPHLSNLGTLASPTPTTTTFRQALSPASAAAANTHAIPAAHAEAAQLDAASPGLKASSSDASLASHYAQSTATNATARHIRERNRESAMALLNNENSFGFEVSPSIPFSSIDTDAIPSSLDGATSRQVGRVSDVEAAFQHPATQDGFESDNDGLNLDLSTDSRSKRRAGLVGLGLDAVPPQTVEELDHTQADSTEQQARMEDQAAMVPNKELQIDEPGRASKLRQSLAQLRVPQPTSQDLLSSPASYTDEESMEDDAFYQLYSPATGGVDEDDESDDQGDQGEVGHQHGDETLKAKEHLCEAPPSGSVPGRRADDAIALGLGLVSADASPKHAQQFHDADFPTTPPQRLFHRGMAAVPVDPSPSTETEFGEARRTPWTGSSPGGFNLPLRLSNSLMSTAQMMSPESPAADPSQYMRGPAGSRKTRGDWPMSIASSGTLPPGRESLESRREVESRRRSSEEERRNINGAPAIGSPLVELPEDEAMNEVAQSTEPANDTTRMSDFELLSISKAHVQPSSRAQEVLASSFVAKYGADPEQGLQSRSPAPGNKLLVPLSHLNGASSNNSSNLSLNDLSDADGEVNDDYLRKVDRMADKLGKLARTNKPPGSSDVASTAGPRGAVRPTAPKLERNDTNGSRFTEHLSEYVERPSADHTALAANEKLHPFPGLSLASPVQSQDVFSTSAVSTALPSPALTGPAVPPKPCRSDSSDTPSTVNAAKEDQEATGKQIGLFSSIRRKASTLRRTPSSAKEGSSFWARRGKKEESPKLPTEATFISAPILTDATPGPTEDPAQPAVPLPNPLVRVSNGSIRRERHHDTTSEHRLPDKQSTGKTAATPADLQRNASISSVVSSSTRMGLQDGTADRDGSSSSDHHGSAAHMLAPNATAMIHRYSRMLSTADLTQTVPGATPEDMRDPPRKLLASDPVFQVISATTIKDRYLFLFSDILVIAKPIAPPGAEAGQSMGKMKRASILPSLSWKFSVKNILELHRLKVSVTSNTRTSSAKTRAQNPVLWGFVSHFSKDPDAAVRALVAKTGLEPTATSIAQLLYQTPELDRHDLTEYVCQPSRREILKAYVSQHRHVGVSIESALRTLLLDLRFPSDLDAFEALLMHFAQSWTQHNAAMIKPTFTAQIASDLVFAIMALNDALHTGSHAGPSSDTSPNFPRPTTVDTPGLFSAACPELSKSDFVSVFRQHDPHSVLSDRTLSRIYLSIRSEPLVQALDRFEPRFTIRVRGGKLPTRLTYAQPGEAVTLVIPAPDPDLAIRLYAQDTTFEPPVLTFSSSNEASFTMWTKSLGPKQVVFVRAGRNARFYGGTEVEAGSEDSVLPRSLNVTVERAFMKHSFTLSNGAEEKFMLSFEDGERVERWTRAIRAQVEEGVKQKAVRGMMGRATEMASLQVLRETLIAPEEPGTGLSRATTVSGARAGHGLGVNSTLKTPAMLDRNTSTSRHYYANSGVGRLERELLIPASVQAGGGGGGHTKGSASLSLSHYPPSTSVTRLAPGGSVARSNSARSASSTLSPLAPLPSAVEGDTSGGGARSGAGQGERVMQGTQIVSIARLNSLLVRVVAHHQAQQAQQYP